MLLSIASFILPTSIDPQSRDLERMERPVSTTKAHDTIINMVAAKGTEVLSSSRDGVVKLWDTRQSDPIGNIFSKEPSLDAWSVAFSNNDTRQLIAIGYENGDLALFDISAAQYVWKTNVGAGVSYKDDAYVRIHGSHTMRVGLFSHILE